MKLNNEKKGRGIMFTDGWSLDYEATNMNLIYLDCNKVSTIFSLAYFLRHVIISRKI